MSEEQPIETIVEQLVTNKEEQVTIVKKYKPSISYFGQFGILIGMIGAGLLVGGLRITGCVITSLRYRGTYLLNHSSNGFFSNFPN